MRQDDTLSAGLTPLVDDKSDQFGSGGFLVVIGGKSAAIRLTNQRALSVSITIMRGVNSPE